MLIDCDVLVRRVMYDFVLLFTESYSRELMLPESFTRGMYLVCVKSIFAAKLVEIVFIGSRRF
jgi:hypothetical protein